MQFIPIKTRILQPPQDDLFVVFDEYLPPLQSGDVVVVTSKVVSIHLGLCFKADGQSIHELTKQQADAYMSKEGSTDTWPLTIKHHAFLYRAGIDHSNSAGYYTVLPEDPATIAKTIWEYLREKHTVENLGVIISDSTVLPFRKGVVSTAIAIAGFVPVRTHAAGQQDLFGEPVVETSTNLADALAAGSSVVSGEADESTPIVLVRKVPNIAFSAANHTDDFLIDPKRDLYTPLLKPFFDHE